MDSVKCSKCGLVNFAIQEVCKRCGNFVKVASSAQLNSHEKSKLSKFADSVISRNQEIGIGCLFIFVGLLVFVINWYSAVYEGRFWSASTILAPVMLGSGLMLIIIPYPDKEKFPKAEFAPKTWAVFLIIGFIVGVLNWCYFMFGF